MIEVHSGGKTSNPNGGVAVARVFRALLLSVTPISWENVAIVDISKRIGYKSVVEIQAQLGGILDILSPDSK